MGHFDRSKETDWQPYFTTRLVDDFGTHLRVFRKAQQRIAEKGDQMKGNIMTKTFFILSLELASVLHVWNIVNFIIQVYSQVSDLYRKVCLLLFSFV